MVDKQSDSSPRDHLANERTFLAWIRTSIGIMVFGFVVEKFALFLHQITAFLDPHSPKQETPVPFYASSSLQGYSSIFGIFLVAFGTLICLLAFVKYKMVEKQIENNAYHPSLLLNIILTLSVFLIGFFLVIYLINSI